MESKDLKDYASVIRDMIRHENDLTNHRLSWLLATQGVLLAAAAAFWDKHWAPFAAVAILGTVTTISFFYSLWLTGRARRHLRELYHTKVKLFPALQEEIPPIAGDSPSVVSRSWLNPWILIPWAVVGTWIVLLVLRLALMPFGH